MTLIMKLSNTLILFFCVFTQTIGQTFTLSELKKMVKMKEKDFVTLVSNKGFTSYKMKDEGEIEKSMTFVSKKSETMGKSISWNYYMFGESVGVRFDTEDINDFKAIENQIINLKLKVKGVKNDKWENGIEYSLITYEMDEYEVALWKEGGGFIISVALWKK
ncbi:MAG: hypothetical protein RL108_1861 [Bacteroidota bacterium]|jgi:hypothetical protein